MSQKPMFVCVKCGFRCADLEPEGPGSGPTCVACWEELHHAGMELAEAAYLDEGAYRAAQSTFMKPLAEWEVDHLDALAEGSHGGDPSDRPSR